MLEAKHRGQPLVLDIRVSDEILIKRLLGRRTCPVCGEIYNIYFNPPKHDEICDYDGAKLVQRADDNAESIRNRLAAYKKATRPLIDHYRGKNLLHEVDGSKPPEAVTRDLIDCLRKA